MMRVTTFDNGWFHRMIEAQLAKQPDASPDALAVARGIMVAGALVADAIDTARDGIADELIELTAGIIGVTNQCESVAKQCDKLGTAVAGAGAHVASALYDLPTPVFQCNNVPAGG